ncbi:lysylphosphatidylglycerol synthase transmembrane domain-containing protein [Candidatus Omnitrophota bacterium]
MVKREKISFFVKIVISFGLLLGLLWIMRHNIGDVIDILKKSNKVFFAVALLISLPLTVATSFRLKVVMSGQGISLPLKDFIYLTFIGYFFNNFFPTAIGGDVAKGYYASKKTNNATASYAAILVDRMIGALSCLSIAVIGIIFVGKEIGNNKVILAVPLMLVALVSFFFLLANKERVRFMLPIFEKIGLLNKIKNTISKLYNAINSYKHNVGFLTKAYFLGVSTQFFAILSVYFFVLSVGGNMPLLKLFLIIPLVWALSMLPSLNGLGVRESAFVYFLKGDIGADKAFSISILWLSVIILYGIIGGVLHLAYPLKVKKPAIT